MIVYYYPTRYSVKELYQELRCRIVGYLCVRRGSRWPGSRGGVGASVCLAAGPAWSATAPSVPPSLPLPAAAPSPLESTQLCSDANNLNHSA